MNTMQHFEMHSLIAPLRGGTQCGVVNVVWLSQESISTYATQHPPQQAYKFLYNMLMFKVTKQNFSYLDSLRRYENPMAGYRHFVDMGYSSREASIIMEGWTSTYSSMDEPDTEATVQARVDKFNAQLEEDAKA